MGLRCRMHQGWQVMFQDMLGPKHGSLRNWISPDPILFILLLLLFVWGGGEICKS